MCFLPEKKYEGNVAISVVKPITFTSFDLDYPKYMQMKAVAILKRALGGFDSNLKKGPG